MEYYHVDVFSKNPLSGNGLTAVFLEEQISKDLMLQITREFNQFETIFLRHINDMIYSANVFTVQEELPFAGHPILGAAACIHRRNHVNTEDIEIQLKLVDKIVSVCSTRTDYGYLVTMNQGEPSFLGEITDKASKEIIMNALNCHVNQLSIDLPIEIVSTGLPYLLVPIKSGIEKSKILHQPFEPFLKSFGAKFVYIFDENTLKCRTWDNDGVIEDIATGSAAGPLAAYLVKHKIKRLNEEIELYQGEFVNRPSILTAKVVTTGNNFSVFLSGDVSFFAKGNLVI